MNNEFRYLCSVEIFNFIFRLGVVFAIFGFLWGIFDIGLRLLTASRQRTMVETYIIKSCKYILLVDVTFLFCYEGIDRHLLVQNQVILTGIILLTYFVGKMQRSQNRTMIFQMMGRGMPKMPMFLFNLKAEIGVIVGSMLLFGLFWFYPHWAENSISRWFHESILDIEDTPVFGFIFKVIGFFFVLSMIFRMVNAFIFLLNGGKRPNSGDNNSDPFDRNSKNNDGFVDYEEVE